MQSVIDFDAFCRGGNIASSDVDRIDRIISKAGRVMGRTQIDFQKY